MLHIVLHIVKLAMKYSHHIIANMVGLIIAAILGHFMLTQFHISPDQNYSHYVSKIQPVGSKTMVPVPLIMRYNISFVNSYLAGMILGYLLYFIFSLFEKIGVKRLTTWYFQKALLLPENHEFSRNILFNGAIRSALIFGMLSTIILIFGIKISILSIIIFISFILAAKKFFPIQNSSIAANTEQFTFKIGKETINVANPFTGILITGGAGSGKSKSLIEPIIAQMGHNSYSGIIYDYKYPVLAKVVNGSYNEKSQIKKHFINFHRLEESARINPLHPDLIKNISYAREFAITIIYNLDKEAIKTRSFWVQSAEALLTASIYFLKEEWPKYCTLPHAIALLLQDDKESIIKAFQTNKQVAGIISSVSSALENANMLSSMFATVQNQLSVLFTKEIFWVLSGNDFSLDLNNKEAPRVLVIGNMPTLSSTFGPVISLIVASSLKQMNQHGKQISAVLLDEAPTLFIPGFDEIPATARSNKVSTIFCAQDISQIIDKYGQTKAETIVSNLGNQFYGRTSNPATAERISKLFGKFDKIFESRGRTISLNGKSNNTNMSVQQRDRIEAQEAFRFETGYFCGIISEGNKNEFQGKFNYWEGASHPIPVLNEITDKEIKENFIEIYDTAGDILKSYDLG